MSHPLLIRADANREIGSGHVMRCLALAQAWRDECGPAIFLTSNEGSMISERLLDEGMEVKFSTQSPASSGDADETVQLAKELNAAWIVVDGYRFDSRFQERLKEADRRVLWIDDYGHAEKYCADFVLNHNIYACEGIYSQRAKDTKLLLGLRYALLRREFTKWRTWKREFPERASRILVTLGGADPDNATERAAQALVSIPGLEVKIVTGADNPHRAALQKYAERPNSGIEVLCGVRDMPGLMAWADLAISAGGGTSWELALFGLPSTVIVIADNQKPIAERLHEEGVAIDLGWREDVAPEDIRRAVLELRDDRRKREAMSRAGREAVDGLGARRVVRELVESP